MNDNSFSDISLLIVGYDGYSDVWNHFFRLLNIFWRDRPATYFSDNVLQPDYDGVIVINCGLDAEWSKKTQVALDHIDTRYVILMLEDFFISGEVDGRAISELVEIAASNQVKFIQLARQLQRSKRFMGNSFHHYKNLQMIPKERTYRINLQAALWDVAYLRERIGEGNYNAWRFELRQVEEHTEIENDLLLYDNRNILNITHAVVQSQYLPNAVAKMKRLGLPIDPKERKVMGTGDYIKYLSKLYVGSIVPKPLWQEYFKSIGRKMKFDFVSDRF